MLRLSFCFKAASLLQTDAGSDLKRQIINSPVPQYSRIREEFDLGDFQLALRKLAWVNPESSSRPPASLPRPVPLDVRARSVQFRLAFVSYPA